MLESFRARQPGERLSRIAWWHFLHSMCYLWVAPCYRYRAWGVHNIPRTGPVMLVSNHQSFLDPILVGLAAHHRQFYAMARDTLFDKPQFAWLIRSLNAIPINRDEMDMGAMRRSLEVLKQQHALLIFPEGTRTQDGTTGTFAPGTMLLIKRSGAPVVPVAIEGAFDAWPRRKKLPGLTGRIGVSYGKPIASKVLSDMGAQAGMNYLQQQVETMRLELVEKLARQH
jgi:1-acyl-sn-glycerol-3-phosphate acyltransferase